MIELNRATHTYSPNLPSVTQILKSAGMIDLQWFTEEARERGKAVHLACEYYDQEDLDLDSVDPRIQGYLKGYIKYRIVEGTDYEKIEIPHIDKSGLYAGTPDRIIVVRPRALTDIKTGQPEEWHGVQLAAYLNMLDDPFSYSRFGLYLRNDGTYSLKEFPRADYVHDLNIFISALNIYNWKARTNGNPSNGA